MAFRNRKKNPDYKPKKGVYLLPNTITLCGMFSGFFAIISAINGNYLYAAWAIILANVFDGLDGWIARLTNTSTRFGIELDSLSDLVAFGVAPAVMMYNWALRPFDRLGLAVSFLFVACGALRLARFNVQTGTPGSKAFKGMPIPGAATVLASVVIFYYEFWTGPPDNNIFYPVITILLALLMVSTLRYHGLKEVDFRERRPFWVLIVFVLVIFIMFIHPSKSIFIFSMSYLIWGIIENIILLIRRKRLHTADQQPDKEGPAQGRPDKISSEHGENVNENY
jgi:CDP-diacylglycerol--serine O-phosphatidyltransferase